MFSKYDRTGFKYAKNKVYSIIKSYFPASFIQIGVFWVSCTYSYLCICIYIYIYIYQ